jgi:hypothetical protein
MQNPIWNNPLQVPILSAQSSWFLTFAALKGLAFLCLLLKGFGFSSLLPEKFATHKAKDIRHDFF